MKKGEAEGAKGRRGDMATWRKGDGANRQFENLKICRFAIECSNLIPYDRKQFKNK